MNNKLKLIYLVKKIILDLLTLSRTRPAKKEKVALSSLITDVLEKHSPPQKIKLIYELPSSPCYLFVDSTQIKEVLTNLITNSYQAMPEGGKLTIKVETKEDKVFIFITDTGSGIPAKNIKKLFEPLFTTKAKGVGLGLTIAKSLTELNGGKIKIESREGESTSLTLIFN